MATLSGTKIFITGGAGFIGSHIVEDLLQAGAKVTVYDNLSSGTLEHLAAAKNDFRFVEGDILDAERLSAAMQEHDLVSHQAAQLEILKCLDDPVDDLRTNTVGTLNVLAAAVKAGVKKIVAASSACVYGQAQSLPQNEDTHPTSPNWAYGVSKLAAEKYGAIFTDHYHLPVTMLRYGIIYGPREWYGRVMTLFLKRASEKKPLVVFGDGQQMRDFTYVGDVVNMHRICLENPAADGEVFNVSTAVGTTINALAKLIADQTGAEIIHDDVREGHASAHMQERVRLPAELKTMVLDNAKAKQKLGWIPATSLADGIRAEQQWLQSHQHLWTTIAI